MNNNKILSHPDLVLLLSQLFFKASLEHHEYKLAENIADIVFHLVPPNLRRYNIYIIIIIYIIYTSSSYIS